MRREKRVNKSHTRLHLLLENSKQKQALFPRTKGNVLQGVSLSQYCSFHYSLEVRGDQKSVISSSQPRSGWQEHKAGMWWPQSLGLCDRGDPQQ